MDTWQDRLLRATNGTLLGAISRCALGRNVVGGVKQFHGKATVTSDGFLMCNYADENGDVHSYAFVGSYADFERNVTGVADHLQLPDHERAEWYAAAHGWIALDYRQN